MRTLPKVVCVLIGALIGSSAIAEELDPRVAALKTDLNLSEKQTKKLNDVFVETYDEIHSLRQEIIELTKKKQESINEILTAEQKKKYEALTAPSFPAEAQPPTTPME